MHFPKITVMHKKSLTFYANAYILKLSIPVYTKIGYKAISTNYANAIHTSICFCKCNYRKET